jgi:hypothetical protein
MPVVVTLPAPIYHRLIEEWTSPTERLMQPSRAKHLANGRVQFNVPDAIAEMMREFMLDGESFQDAIERLLAKAGGQIS